MTRVVWLPSLCLAFLFSGGCSSPPAEQTPFPPDGVSPEDTLPPIEQDTLPPTAELPTPTDSDTPGELPAVLPNPPSLHSCVPNQPCPIAAPFCTESFCNEAGFCELRPLDNCCSDDSDCSDSRPQACITKRCVNTRCVPLPEPLCCTTPESCDDGLSLTSDRCLSDTKRCESCAPSCPEQANAALFQASFDSADSLITGNFSIADANLVDDVTWRFDSTVAAGGAGSLRLGRLLCQTYDNGTLTPNCVPIAPNHSSSTRVWVSLFTPLIQLPHDSPSLGQVMVRSLVEPYQHLGNQEKDLLRISVLSTESPISWPLVTTAAFGKVFEDWQPVIFDLAPWRGKQIQLKFEFDTLDGQNNAYGGVWLDELKIKAACANGSCCTTDSECVPSHGCEEAKCIALPQGNGSRCVSLPKAQCQVCDVDSGCDDSDPCTSDRCESGQCQHTRFCCLDRILTGFAHNSDYVSPWTSTILGATSSGWYAQAGALRFGNRNTQLYEATNQRVHGTLTSPLVVLPLTPQRRLEARFHLNLTTEWSGQLAQANPEGLDLLTLELSENNTSVVLWTSDSIWGSTPAEGQAITIPLDLWRGHEIRLRFRFDSGDGNRNAFEGPVIRNFQVVETCQP